MYILIKTACKLYKAKSFINCLNASRSHRLVHVHQLSPDVAARYIWCYNRTIFCKWFQIFDQFGTHMHIYTKQISMLNTSRIFLILTTTFKVKLLKLKVVCNLFQTERPRHTIHGIDWQVNKESQIAEFETYRWSPSLHFQGYTFQF